MSICQYVNLFLLPGHPRPTARLQNLRAAPPRVPNLARQPIVPLRLGEGRRGPRQGQWRRTGGGGRLCRAPLAAGGRRGEGALCRERGGLEQGTLVGFVDY